MDGSMRDLLVEHPKDLSDRIHFVGPQSDADFLAVLEHGLLLDAFAVEPRAVESAQVP